MRAARGGVPAGHDPCRQPLRRAAQRARHLHPTAVQLGRHRRRAGVVLRHRETRAERPHYEGLPVDFLAEAIAAIGPRKPDPADGFDTYNTTNPHDDGISLDTFVDWIIAAGYPDRTDRRLPDWLDRFETSMRALPERERAQSVLTVLDVYREPMPAIAGSLVPGTRFQTAVECCRPRHPASVTSELIAKYLVRPQPARGAEPVIPERDTKSGTDKDDSDADFNTHSVSRRRDRCPQRPPRPGGTGQYRPARRRPRSSPPTTTSRSPTTSSTSASPTT